MVLGVSPLAFLFGWVWLLLEWILFAGMQFSGRCLQHRISGRRKTDTYLEAILDLCLLCGKERETIDHLFLYSEFSYILWCRVIDWGALVLSRIVDEGDRGLEDVPFLWV